MVSCLKNPGMAKSYFFTAKLLLLEVPQGDILMKTVGYGKSITEK